MDHSVPRARDFEVDLEKGGGFNDEQLSKITILGAKKQASMMFAKVCVGFVDGKIKGIDGLSCNEVFTENAKEAAENVNSADKKTAREKHKKSNSNKKAPKPPRPPKGPSLDAADKKLIKEISEIAMLKRARIERMKALKKMKAMKSPSSESNVLAMVFTVIFFLVILFQGMPSRTNRHPGLLQNGVVSAQYYGNPSTNDLHGPASGVPYLVAGSEAKTAVARRFLR